MVLRSDSYKGPWSGPSGVQSPVILTAIQAFLSYTRWTRWKWHRAVPSGAKRTALYRVGGADSNHQVAPPSVEDNTPPLFWP